MEIKLRGRRGLSTFVDADDYISLNLDLYKWHAVSGESTLYVGTKTHNRKFPMTIRLHRLIMGVVDAPRSVVIDHIDHNGLNNTRSNLRITDQRGNNRNSRKRQAKTSSSFKGVTHVKNELNPWWARIRMPGHTHKSLGYYPTEVEAAQAYNKAATEFFKEFACLNVIP